MKWNKTALVVCSIAGILVLSLPAQVVNVSEDTGLRMPNQDQFKRLYNALVSQPPECVRVICFATLKRTPESDEELLADAKTEQQYFQNGQNKTAMERDADLKAIITREKSENDGMMYFWERETKIKNAYRLDRTIYETSILPKALGGLQTVETLSTFFIASSNHFETTIVSDQAKGDFYHFQVNWRAGSSSYANLQGTVPADPGLDSVLYLPGELQLLLLRPFMRNSNSLTKEEYDNSRFASFLSNTNCPYKVAVLESNLSGIEVDDFQLRFQKAPSYPVIAEFMCDRTNYNRLYSFTFYSTNGEVSWHQDRMHYDTNNFPWLIKMRYHEGRSTNWTEELRQYVKIEYPHQIDREAVFSFHPPDSFSIENYSSGQTVIERYPLINGKRLGPQNLAVNQGDPKMPWQKPFVQALLLTLIAVPPVFFAVVSWLKKHKHHDNEK
jgi:hypothetical protein